MDIRITGAPCSWGVDDPKNPYLPPWKSVLEEASAAGYKGIELGPYGYLPLDTKIVSEELQKNKLSIVAGTIFDDLVSEQNFPAMEKAARDICGMLVNLPKPEVVSGVHFPAPYLVLIDWGHDKRDYAAGHPDVAPRLSGEDFKKLIGHIKGLCRIANGEYGVRPVIHPHAGGYIEFADEIDNIAEGITKEEAGLCLDTGHLWYSKMEPCKWLRKYADRLDYVHFKDINKAMYDQVMTEKIRFFDGCGKGVMCPIGEGVLDYGEIFNCLRDIGYNGYITIEQERDPRNASGSLKDVRRSLQYLDRFM
ncbi:MAG: sugar phosphate isomerase/epimerase [Lachnospiraceae bacterium]|jgi:inosose dehydratase|nr:sugar phosphate isomerase/epimerase [Lachnospiraceae bacterium]